MFGKITALPAWVLVVGFLAVALGVLWYRERSARGVQRAAERSSKKAAAGLTVGVGGLLYGALGASRGLSGVLSVFGDVLLEIPDVAAYFGTSAVGYFALNGDLALSASWFAAIAGTLFLLGVALDD